MPHFVTSLSVLFDVPPDEVFMVIIKMLDEFLSV